MNDQTIEQEIQAKGLTAPRVTPADIDALLARVSHTYEVQGTSTFCHAFLDGEFYIATGHSACVSKENFDPALGRKIAFQNMGKPARDKLWELEGYALRKKLKAAPATFQERVVAEKSELDEKITKLRAFLSKPSIMDLPKDERDRLTSQLSCMDGYSSILAQRIAAFA